MITAGIDLGTSLTKVYWSGNHGECFRTTVSRALWGVVAQMKEDGVSAVRIVGQGKRPSELSMILDGLVIKPPAADPLSEEFDCQIAGARRLLKRTPNPPGAFVLASVGTGMSYSVVTPVNVENILYGNALGGGSLMGLASLIGVESPQELDRLAMSGHPADIIISDQLPTCQGTADGLLALSHFGKMTPMTDRSAVAASIVRCVATAVVRDALILSGGRTNVLVCLGTTVQNMKSLRRDLILLTKISNQRLVVPENAAYALAIGASL